MYVVLLMTFYWVTEALPLPITGTLPIVLFPALNIMVGASKQMKIKDDTILILPQLV